MENYREIEKKIQKKISPSIICSEENGAIKLEGLLRYWDNVVKAGQIAAKGPYRGVINKIRIPNSQQDYFSKPTVIGTNLEGKDVDVLVIGAGIIGSSIARELSRYNLKILVIDKEYDVAVHTSSRNDGMIHPGFAAKTGTLKSILNVRGNKMYDQVAEELGVKIKKNGSYILFDQQMTKPAYYYMRSKAEKVGINEYEFLNRERLFKKLPHLNQEMQWGFYLPTAGVTSPYKMTVAYAENAITNGVDFSLNTAAIAINKNLQKISSVNTTQGKVFPKVVINAAGTFTDIIADMAGDRYYTIHPRKGEIALLDKKTGIFLDAILGKPSLSLRARTSKGGGLIKTIEGNLLVGPNHYEVDNREDYSTNRKSLNEMLNKQLRLIPSLKKNDVITYFAGTRASTYKEDFIIERSNSVANLIHVAGIQSPGFASAPAIAEKVKNICVNYLLTQQEVIINRKFNPIRKAPYELASMDMYQRANIIRENPDYGKIICRCEEISKGEILDALRSPLPVDTVDGVKRRTRAGMGRCQSGFCLPHVMEIISEEKKLNLNQIAKKAKESQLVLEETKGDKIYV